MAYGEPVSGKSTAVEAAMAVIGQSERIGECTLAGAMEMISRQSFPYWWDDADNFSILEKLAVSAFNKSNKKTGKSKSGYLSPRTVPVITMNPTAVSVNVKNDKAKLSRTFSRIVVIPFTKLKRGKHTLANSLNLQTHLKEVMPHLLRSVGVIIELGHAFASSREDPLFQEVLETIEEAADLDMRTQCNYALVLYSTAKIIEKIGLKDLFPKVKEWMVKAVLPLHQNLVGVHQNEAEGNKKPAEKLIVDITKKVIANPKEGKEFFNPSFSARKCHCGEVFGFNISKALAFVEAQGVENSLRSYIRAKSIGCNGVKLMCGKKQYVGTHIKTTALPEELRVSLYEAFHIKNESVLSSAVRAACMVENATPMAEKPVSKAEVNVIGINAPGPSGISDDKEDTMPMVNKTVDTAQVIDINAPGPSGISDDKEDTMPMVNKTVDTAQVIGTNAPGPSGKTDDKDGSASAVRKQRKKRKMLNNLNDELSDYYKPTDKSAKRRNQQK